MKRKLASILTALALCLSLCPGWAFAVEEEPDGAGDPMPLSTGDIELTQGTRAIFTEAGCGGNCPGHRITQADSTTAVDATYVYVESGEHKVTFSGLNLTGANTGVMPGGTMHLTIDGSNSIAANNLAGIYVPETATLTIDGSGSLEVKSTSGAGIGGSRYALDNSAGDSDCGTVVINGGTITVTGGSSSAGIGGTNAATPGGKGGTVTINGGNVTVTGGNNAWGGPAIGGTIGNPAGCGGTLTINGGHVTLNAKNKAYGFGSGENMQADGPSKMILASKDCLTLGEGTILDPRAEYEIMGNPLTMDLISVPEGLTYTGADLTEEARKQISLGSEAGEKTEIHGVGFAVITDTTGWSGPTIVPAEVKEAGEYTVTYTKGSDSISKTFTVSGYSASLEAVKTYWGTAEAVDFGVGETITVKAPAPTFSLNAVQTAAFTEPTTAQMAVYCNGTQVSAPAGANPDSSYTMTVDTNDLVKLLNLSFSDDAPEKTVPLTVKYIGNASVSGAERTVDVIISAAAKIEKNGKVSYVGERNLDSAFKPDSGNDGATITMLQDVEGGPLVNIHINCTLELNEKLINTKDEEAVLYVQPGYQVTILGSGEVFGSATTPLVVAGDVTLKGGRFSYTSPTTEPVAGSCAVSVVSGGKLSVTGDVTIANGHGYGLEIVDDAEVQLSGGTYIGVEGAFRFTNSGDTVYDRTLAGLLAPGKTLYKEDGTALTAEELAGTGAGTSLFTVGCAHKKLENPVANQTADSDVVPVTATCADCGQKNITLGTLTLAGNNQTITFGEDFQSLSVTAEGFVPEQYYWYNGDSPAGRGNSYTPDASYYGYAGTYSYSCKVYLPEISSPATVNFELTKEQADIKDAVITLNEGFATNMVYNGTAYTINEDSYVKTVTVNGKEANSSNYTVQIGDSKSQTAAGSYQIKLIGRQLLKGEVTLDTPFVINPARPTIEWTGEPVKTVTYGETVELSPYIRNFSLAFFGKVCYNKQRYKPAGLVHR